MAEEILQEAGVEYLPIDAMHVAQRLGITVAWDQRQEGRARYVRLSSRSGPPKATILLKPDPRFERRQWAVAHEIGEHAAYRVFARWGVDPRETQSNARELVANNLAGRLLLPTVWFAADAAACRWDLLELKARYITASHELIARRMLECRPAVIISIFDQQRLSFRRGNLPGPTPPPQPDEMECWREVHRRCCPFQAGPSYRRVCGWPVHEEGWKREILRMEIEEWEP